MVSQGYKALKERRYRLDFTFVQYVKKNRKKKPRILKSLKKPKISLSRLEPPRIYQCKGQTFI